MSVRPDPEPTPSVMTSIGSRSGSGSTDSSDISLTRALILTSQAS